MRQHQSFWFVCSLAFAGQLFLAVSSGFCQGFELKNIVLTSEGLGRYTYEATFAAGETKKVNVTLEGNKSAADELATGIQGSLASTRLLATMTRSGDNTLAIEMNNTTGAQLTASVSYEVTETKVALSYKLLEESGLLQSSLALSSQTASNADEKKARITYRSTTTKAAISASNVNVGDRYRRQISIPMLNHPVSESPLVTVTPHKGLVTRTIRIMNDGGAVTPPKPVALPKGTVNVFDSAGAFVVARDLGNDLMLDKSADIVTRVEPTVEVTWNGPATDVFEANRLEADGILVYLPWKTSLGTFVNTSTAPVTVRVVNPAEPKYEVDIVVPGMATVKRAVGITRGTQEARLDLAIVRDSPSSLDQIKQVQRFNVANPAPLRQRLLTIQGYHAAILDLRKQAENLGIHKLAAETARDALLNVQPKPLARVDRLRGRILDLEERIAGNARIQSNTMRDLVRLLYGIP